MRFPMIIVLCWLSSFSLIGCNQPPLKAADQEAKQEADDSDFDILNEDSGSDPSSSDDGSAELESLYLTSTEGPDPLGDDPIELQGLKAAPRQPTTYLNCYGWIARDPQNPNQWCTATQLYLADKKKVQAWCNERGISSSEMNVEGYRRAHVRFIEGPRDKWTRDISFGNAQPRYPTYVMTNAQGKMFWHSTGLFDPDIASMMWDAGNQQPSRVDLQSILKRFSGNADPPPAENFRYECGPNGCRIIRN